MVVVVVVVVVGAGHASQQLMHVPAVSCVPVQSAVSFLIWHLVPLVVVRQQVTAPARLPQIEWAAHFLTAPAQLLLVRAVFAFCTAQLT
jgi:hypothetical protein